MLLLKEMKCLNSCRQISARRFGFVSSPAHVLQPRFFTHGPVRRVSEAQGTQTSCVEDYDIVVVGGGVVGLALANALGSCRTFRESGYRISVLEASDLSKIKDWNLPSDQRSNRVSSVSAENIRFLKKTGAWKYIDRTRTNPLERLLAWDGISNARITFDALDGTAPSLVHTETPQMAQFVENVHLQKALLRNLDSQSNVQLYAPSKVVSISADDADWPVIKLEDGRQLRARLLVGADGFNSPVKSYSKITSTGWNYDAQCVVGTLDLEPSMDNFTAWQRFLTTGPLATLPLSDRLASLAWSTKPHIAAGLKALDSQTLASTINACFYLPHESVNHILNRIGSHSTSNPIDSNEIQSEIEWRSSPSVLPVGSVVNDELPPKVLRARMETVASFPLRMFHADQYLGTVAGTMDESAEDSSRSTRTVLVGDAAHVMHPLAGQGLNLGLGDARVLADTLRTAIENGQDIGSLTALAPYAKTRYVKNHLTMAVVDKLHKLYSLDVPPIVWARSVGCEVLNEIPILKAAMMVNAGGTSQDLRSTYSSRLWSAAADVYEGAQKVAMIAKSLGGLASGVVMSGIHRATAPKG